MIGVAVPLAMWSTGSPALYPAVVAGVLVGEILDRCEFYVELDAPAPSKQMASDLAKDRFYQDRSGDKGGINVGAGADGCDCQTGAGGSGVLPTLMMLLGLLLVRRRRRG